MRAVQWVVYFDVYGVPITHVCLKLTQLQALVMALAAHEVDYRVCVETMDM